MLAHGNYFIHNKDESILFRRAFFPNHDDRDLGINYKTDILIIEQKSYQIINDETIVFEEERNGIMYHEMTINIRENEFVENSSNKEESLAILKRVITEKEIKSIPLKDYQEIIEITFCYKGFKSKNYNQKKRGRYETYKNGDSVINNSNFPQGFFHVTRNKYGISCN